MHIPYRQLVSPHSLTAHEEKNHYFSLTERHLQVLWLEQKFFTELLTLQGERIEVLSPGIWNAEAGPDFLKAHFRIGSQEYRGDVEIHLHDRGWNQHGHHLDQRYNQVALHLSYWQPAQSQPMYKENGTQPFCCYLEDKLTIPIYRLNRLVDFDHYPSKRFVGSGRCAEKLFGLLPERRIKLLLQSAAYWRLEKKMQHLEQYFSDRPLQFAGGIGMAMGYQHNAAAFLDLYLFLFPFRDLPYDELLAIALGCCGFLEEGRKQSWELSHYYQSLRSLWWGKRDQIIHQAHLKLDHIRPYHHPIRRLAYLVSLLQDPDLERLWGKFLRIWTRSNAGSKKEFILLKEELLQVIPHYDDPYWSSHYTFEARSQSKRLPMLGDDLKTQILLNTALPLLYAAMKENDRPSDWEKFQKFYLSLKTDFPNKSRYLHQRFFGEDSAHSLLSQAQIAQGAYQLHHDFCVHFEASCEGCPFVERYFSNEDPAFFKQTSFEESNE